MANQAGIFNNAVNAIDFVKQWTPELAQQNGIMGIPLGQAPMTAEQLYTMLNRSATDNQLAAPGGNISAEDYLQYADMYQQAQENKSQQAAVDAAYAATDKAAGAFGDSTIAKAIQGLMSQPASMDTNVFDAMRKTYDANMNPNGVGGNAAARGMLGSNQTQLAGLQRDSARGSAMADATLKGYQFNTDNRNKMLDTYLGMLPNEIDPLISAANQKTNLAGLLFGNTPVTLSTGM